VKRQASQGRIEANADARRFGPKRQDSGGDVINGRPNRKASIGTAFLTSQRFSGVSVMTKGIAIALTLLAVIGFASWARASVLYSFEAPTYGANSPLNGQDGWTATGTNTVYSAGLAGSQSAKLTSGTATHSLAGAGFTDVTEFSELIYGQAVGGSEYIETQLKANNGATEVPFAKFGYQYLPGHGFDVYAYDGGDVVSVQPLNYFDTYSVAASVNFATQKYDVTFTDLTEGHTYSHTISGLSFENSITREQAEANSSVSLAVGGNWYGILDNVALTSTLPEPSTLMLLLTSGLGLLAYAWRKRR
jgi:hypothetical protein